MKAQLQVFTSVIPKSKETLLTIFPHKVLHKLFWSRHEHSHAVCEVLVDPEISAVHDCGVC